MTLHVSFVRAGAFALAVIGWLMTAPVAAQPVVNFQIDPRQVEAGQTVAFKSTTNGGASPLKFQWEFGDGGVSDQENPTHVFLAPNDFIVRLTVTDALDQVRTKEDVLSVDGPTLFAAVLPGSRSVVVGQAATAFVTVINAGLVTADGVSIELDRTTGPIGGPLPADFAFQTTDPVTNLPTGSPNAPASIAPGDRQAFVISVTPREAIPPTEVRFDIAGFNSTRAARTTVGVNTLLLSASTSPAPDIVALAATAEGNGVLELSAARAGAFSVATVNVGAGASITVSADTGSAALPISLLVCRTKPTGECDSSLAPSVDVAIPPGVTPTFAVFANASGPVIFEPGTNRIFVRFRDAGGVVRGATSVAVKGP